MDVKYASVGFDPQVKYVMDNFLARIRYVHTFYPMARYVNLAVRVLNAILEERGIPDDLGVVLEKRDPQALVELRRIIEAVKLVEQPSFEVV